MHAIPFTIVLTLLTCAFALAGTGGRVAACALAILMWPLLESALAA